MNIAFGTVLLFLIFVPGIVLRRTYLSGPFSKKYLNTKPIDELMWAIVPGAILQILGILTTQRLFEHDIDFTSIAYLLIGTKEDANSAYAFAALKNHAAEIMYYNLSLWGIAAILGWTSMKAVRAFKLDRKYLLFRFGNLWHYLLSGEILDFPKISGESKNIGFALLDVLVKDADKSIIYSGELVAYELASEGGLSTITLKNVYRRYLEDDENEDKYYDMPGEFFVIPYARIVNLNIDYYRLVVTN